MGGSQTIVRWLFKVLRGLLSLLSGIAIAIAFIAAGGVIAVRYIVTQIATAPPRPAFTNDPKPGAITAPAPAAIVAAPAPVVPSPSPLPPGSYRARVTQPIGLVLRSAPNRSGARLGSVDYNDRVIVLGNSPDRRWQQVRLGETGPEGWVRSGNTRRVDN
ncbi:MAG: SH3 domain-containing protein [Oscillatoriales cyanobacterium]|nr:MAG: SH3 domain-containing protein [Oscillatoriales cyanobacterium]